MAGKAGFSSEEDGAMSDINVTPLVDVVLVLLIVFMITVPAIVGSAPIKLDLPVTGSVATIVGSFADRVFLEARRESGELEIYLERAKNDGRRAARRIQELPPATISTCRVAPMRAFRYGDVVKFVDLLQSLGMKKTLCSTRGMSSRARSPLWPLTLNLNRRMAHTGSASLGGVESRRPADRGRARRRSSAAPKFPRRPTRGGRQRSSPGLGQRVFGSLGGMVSASANASRIARRADDGDRPDRDRSSLRRRRGW